MTMIEAMEQRHMVRKYTNKPIEMEKVELLNKRIKENNNQYNLTMKLVTNNTSGISRIMKLFMAKGVNNFIILAGLESSDLDEKLGYAGADLMLYAQTLGLNTWWVGGTFNRSVSSLVSNNKVIGVIAIGYGKTQGVPHKSKAASDVAEYDGEEPEWFQNGVKGALLAPTALNKQPFKIQGRGNEVTLTCEGGIFTGADIGLIKYHFELGAESKNFIWK